MKEIDHAQIFEEILHRLPQVNTLKVSVVSPLFATEIHSNGTSFQLTLVGPEMGTIISMPGRLSAVMNMDTCP